MLAGTMKIPDPIMTPITIMVESKRPRALLGCRFACISSRSSRVGFAVGFTAKMLYQGKGASIPTPKQKCHPDRSEAEWRDLLFYFRDRRISSVRMMASAISRIAFRFCRLCFCKAR